MSAIFPFIQIGLSVLLIVLILIQRSDAGVGGSFGGEDGGGHFSRRGIEKTLFRSTVIVALFFVLISILVLVL